MTITIRTTSGKEVVQETEATPEQFEEMVDLLKSIFSEGTKFASFNLGNEDDGSFIIFRAQEIEYIHLHP